MSYSQDYSDGYEYKKINFSFYNNVSNEIVEIQKKKYMISSAIFHHGNNPKRGHYTAMLRQNDGWLNADDPIVRPKSWLNKIAEDVNFYIIFLQEITEESASSTMTFSNIEPTSQIISAYATNSSLSDDLSCGSTKRKLDSFETSDNFLRDHNYHLNKKTKKFSRT